MGYTALNIHENLTFLWDDDIVQPQNYAFAVGGHDRKLKHKEATLSSTITIQQLRELLRQIAEDGIRPEDIREFVERRKGPGLRQLFKSCVQSAYKAASEVHDPCWRGKAVAEIAKLHAELGDFDSARRTAAEITDPYWHSRAMSEIAKATGEPWDLETAQKTGMDITDPYWRSRALVEAARAIGQARSEDERKAA